MYGTRPSKDKSGAYLFLPDGNAKVFPQRLGLRCLLACQKFPMGVVASHLRARGRHQADLVAA